MPHLIPFCHKAAASSYFSREAQKVEKRKARHKPFRFFSLFLNSRRSEWFHDHKPDAWKMLRKSTSHASTAKSSWEKNYIYKILTVESTRFRHETFWRDDVFSNTSAFMWINNDSTGGRRGEAELDPVQHNPLWRRRGGRMEKFTDKRRTESRTHSWFNTAAWGGGVGGGWRFWNIPRRVLYQQSSVHNKDLLDKVYNL